MTMKRIGMQVGLALAIMAGTLPLTIAFDGSSAQAASTDSQAQLRKEIVNAIAQRAESLEIAYKGNEASMKKDIRATLDDAVNSDDYLHYIVKTYGYEASMSGGKAEIDFKFTYWESLSETKEVQKRVSQALRKILTPGMNDYQKVKAIHDWIVTNLSYDTSLAAHSAYDGLVNGETVCQGYALLTYEMMKQAGIPVRIVEGSSRGIAHTWNLVQLGGKWYHLDSTWNDPVPNVAGRVSYDYYNLTDAQMRADHSWPASSSYPAAATPFDQTLSTLNVTDKSKVSFYKTIYEQLGYAYLEDSRTATSLQQLTNKISDAVDKRQKELLVRYTRGVMLKTDMKKAFAGQKGITGYSYSYEDYSLTPINDKLLRIVFKY